MTDHSPAQATSQTPETELLAQVLGGSKEALSALYDRFARQVFSLTLRMVENQSLAEEITQDVFMTVWSRGATYKSDRGSFTAWLLSVTHNRCIDELRRRRRRARLPTMNVDDLHTEPGGNPNEVINEVLATLDRKMLMEALNNIPPPQKQVVLMAYYQGLTQSEISEVLEVPLGTVKTRMRLALQKMRGQPPLR